MRDGGVARAARELEVDRADDGGARVGRVGRRDRHRVRPGGEIERTREVAGLEVVEGELVVHPDVHGRVRHAVQDGERGAVVGGGLGGERDGPQRDEGRCARERGGASCGAVHGVLRWSSPVRPGRSIC
ncbi:Uncharacterised protein [Mycobacteroides abscessus]|nr:Uncharacterised protein [Mycobacteroides abscessus]